MDIPEKILEELVFLADLGHAGDNWMPVKKHLLKSIPSSMRKKFSTRDPKTKKQSLNNFETTVIDRYETMTGIRLRLHNE